MASQCHLLILPLLLVMGGCHRTAMPLDVASTATLPLVPPLPHEPSPPPDRLAVARDVVAIVQGMLQAEAAELVGN